MFLAGMAMTAWAIVPAPPVNQTLGMEDSSFDNLTAAECRVCHVGSQADRHHLLYNSEVADPSIVPYPELTTNYPTPPLLYNCIGCHGDGSPGFPADYRAERDCTECHNAGSPHHTTAAALARQCTVCHGDIVDNFDDGHYIPTYGASLVTPEPSEGNADQLNSRGNGAGACNYCHDDDGLPTPVILTNMQLHHGTGLFDDPGDCSWCHMPTPSFVGDPNWPQPLSIRRCEECHGPDSLHNIQADSDGNGIVVGGELAGYGHVGSDQSPDDSDCWGCHGFAGATGVAYIGPVIPSVVDTDVSVMNAGTATVVTLNGAALTNTAGTESFVSDVALTAADGSSVTLIPDSISQGTMTVTIPATTAPGNYDIQAVKAQFASNPAVISIIPAPVVTDLTCADGTATITGSGFVAYVEGSGTSVSGTVVTTYVDKKGRTRTTTTTETGAVSSWSDTAIVAGFSACPADVTVNSVYGSASTSSGGGTDPPTGSCSDYGNEDSCNADSACEWRTKKKGRGSCKVARRGGGN
jgi:hypothetical protein